MPPGVRPDTLDGRTYVGLVPVPDGRRRPRDACAGVPYLGTFLETNVRLYSVDETGRRGVVFLSLDTDRLPIALGARAAFGVPYRWARMRHARTDEPAGTPPPVRRPAALAAHARDAAG